MTPQPSPSRAITLWWLWAVLGTVVLLIAAQRAWVTGSWEDPVLGRTALSATGAQVGATLTAGALLSGAAFLAGLVGSRPVRLVAGVCLAGGAVLAGLPALRALAEPAGVLQQQAREAPGSATASVLATDATATVWPWVALVAGLLVLASSVLCLLRWRRDRQGATGARPVGESAVRPARAVDAWDELTRGEDPTLDPPQDEATGPHHRA